MIMNVSAVDMGCYDKSMVPFCEAQCEFISNGVCLLRCYLSWLKTLTNVIGEYIFFPPVSALGGQLLVLVF